MFEPKAFRKHMYCIEGSTCNIVRTFLRPRSHLAPRAVTRCPHSDLAPGQLHSPCLSVVTPLVTSGQRRPSPLACRGSHAAAFVVKIALVKFNCIGSTARESTSVTS